MINAKLRDRITRVLYLVIFLTSLHYAFVAYINSSFLENFIAKENIGLLYVVASVISIIIISNLSKALKYLGQFRTYSIVLMVDILAMAGLALTSSPLFPPTMQFQIGDSIASIENPNPIMPWMPLIVIACFLVFQITIILNRVMIDIYMEEFSKKEETGNERGWLLTAMNLAFVFSPFIVGSIINDTSDGFWKIYAISSIFIILAHMVVVNKLRSVKDIEYHSPPILETFRKVSKNKDIFNIYISSFLLEFFYAWMVVYTPIYLNMAMGFNWSQIGIMFSIMLTAFVILEIPLGKIADKYLGEKEILTAGFIIAGLSTAALSLIESRSLIVWTLVLFATRVGVSCIEVMNDTYFFKKVKASDSDVISFFRNASPVAYIVAPALSSLILYFIDYKYLFAILGAIMLTGIKFSLSIKDTL